MPCLAFVRRTAQVCLPLHLLCLASLAFSLAFSLAASPAAQAQSVLHLQADHASVNPGQVLHLRVSSPFSSGGVTFLDGTSPLATVPLDAAGQAALGVATLSRGTHTLSATLAAGAGAGAGTVDANSVQVTVSGLPNAFSFTASPASILPGQPATLTTAGLPQDATGQVLFTDSGVPLGSASFAAPAASYVAYGDAATYGTGFSGAAQTYPGQFGAALGLSVLNRGRPALTTCDVMPHRLLELGDGPTQTAAPLTSLMPALGDTDDPNTLAAFTLCHQAAIAWLAIPREYKTLAGDAAVQPTAGVWTPASTAPLTGGQINPATRTLYNNSGSGSARVTLTTDGGPVYLWYLLENATPGAFTLALDGVPLAGTFGLQPYQYMPSTYGAGGGGFGLARVPAPAGTHTLDVTLLSGSLGILGAGTAPGAGVASVHPTVLVTDFLTQNIACPRDTPATRDTFSAAAQADAQQFAADSLDVRFVATRAFMTGQPEEMADCFVPNPVGNQHLASAFAAVLPAARAGAYLVSPGTPLALPVSLAGQGSHTLSANYPGDARYASSEATFNVTVTDPATTTTLSTPAASLGFGSSVVLTATVSPASASGSFQIYENPGGASQSAYPVHGSVTVNFTPPPGTHTYYAAYSSNDFHAPSLSAPVTVHVDGLASVLTVAAAPQHVPYGAQIHLDASLSVPGCNGQITFSDSLAGVLGTASISRGSASLDAPGLPGGARLLTAAYAGDPVCSPETSAPAQLFIDPIAPSLVVTPLNQPTFGQKQTLHIDLLGHAVPVQPMFPATLDPALNQTSVFLGDSITQFWPLPAHNAGLSGQTTAQMLARFATDVLGHGYERVFLLGGTNDFWHLNLPQEAVLANLEAMAQMAAGAGIRPILCSLLPFSLENVSQDDRVVPFNRALSAYAAANGFLFVDYHAALLAFPNDFLDGIHPTADGQALMQTTLARTLLLPSGTVSLPDGTTATLSASGTATLNTGSAAGTFTQSIAYPGDRNFLAASQPVTFSIARAATTTLLRAQPLAGDTGTIVALSATIGNASGQPTDAALRLLDGATVLGTAAIQPDGSALLTTARLTGGTHHLLADYPGSGNFLPSASPALPLDVAFTGTTLSLATGALSYRTGAPVPLTATLAPASLAGAVTFLDGGMSIGQGTLTNGVASLSTSTLATGSHSLSASYAGDAFNAPAQSPALNVTVAPAPANLSLAPLPASAVYGGTLTLAVGITPADATGQVLFTDSGLALGAAALVNGNASFQVVKPAAGPHSFAATYAGDATTQPAASAKAAYTVTLIPTNLTLKTSVASLAFGDPSPAVTVSLTPVDAGSVLTLTDALTGATLPVTLSGGSATVTLPALSVGVHAFTAAYAGDATTAPAMSAAATVTVTRAATALALAPLPASQTIGTPLVLTASITPANAAGTVLFRDAATGTLGQATLNQGSATLTLGALPVAGYSITAVYAGDPQDLPASSATLGTQVTLIPVTAALSGPVSSPDGADVVLTAALTPATLSGLVTFTDNGLALGSALATGGGAMLHTTALSLGAHSLRVSFAGDATHSAAGSTPLALSIVPDNTATTLSAAQTSVPAGAPLLLNLAVSGSMAQAPTGLVTVRSGGVIVGTATLAHATAHAAYATLTLDSRAFGVGTLQLTAYYAGDTENTLSNSAANPVRVAIVPAPTVVTLTLAAPVTALATPVSLSAAVTASTGLVPTGSIAFMAGPQAIANVTLNAAGSASATFIPAALGATPITAVYTPGALFTAAAAPLQTLTVTPPLQLGLAVATLSAAPGASLEDTLTLTPLSGFSGAVAVACSSSSSFVTCALPTPPTRLPTATETAIHITIAPTLSGFHAALAAPTLGGKGLPLACTLLALLPFARRRRRFTGHLFPGLTLALLSLLCLTAALTGCATGPQDFDRIPPGAHTVTVSVTAAGLTQSMPITVNIQ